MVSQLENKTSAKKSVRKKAVKKIAKPKVVVEKKSGMTVDHFNSIAKSVGFSSIIMTAIVVAITPSQTWILGPVIGAMCIFGIAMGYFASK